MDHTPAVPPRTVNTCSCLLPKHAAEQNQDKPARGQMIILSSNASLHFVHMNTWVTSQNTKRFHTTEKEQSRDIKVSKLPTALDLLPCIRRLTRRKSLGSVYGFGDVVLRWLRWKLKPPDRFLDQIPRQYELLEELVRVVLVDFLSVPRFKTVPFRIARRVVRTGA